MKRIVAYCRVSTDKEEQLESLANQEEFFEQFAKKNKYKLIKIYSDEGISGKQMKNRTQFLQMLKDAESGNFELVVVKDISRFARNTVDFLVAIRELRAIGVDVQFLSTNQTVMGNSEFMLTIFSAMAQEESANLSARVKFGKKQNAKRGKVPNHIYGYDWIDKFNLSINQEQAAIVKRIFREYVDEGIGLRRLSMRLESDNVPAPAGGSHWIPKAVKRVLTNPIYKGTLITRKSVGVDFLSGKRKLLLPEPEYTFQREQYRIISDEYFSKAAKILKERATQYANHNYCNRVSSQYTFSTLIKCEECGYSFTRRLSNSVLVPKYAYWKCSGNNNRGSNFCCNNRTIKDEDLINILKDYFMSVIENPSKIENAINNSMQNETSVDSEMIKKQIEQLNEKKEKFMSMFVNNVITIERLKLETGTIDEKIEVLNQSLTESEDDSQAETVVLSEYLKSYLKKGVFTNVELKKIIEKISVNHNGKITIHFKKDIA